MAFRQARMRLVLAVAVLAVVAVAPGAAGKQGAGASKQQTNSVAYVSTSGEDRNPCTSAAAPCLTFDRAYRAVRPGGTVEIAAGSYPLQRLRADPSKAGSTARVVFRPAPGASVTIAEFIAGDTRTGSGPQAFELRDLAVSRELELSRGTENVVLRNIDGGTFNLTATRNIEILGGDWGPGVDTLNHIKSCSDPGCFAAEDIVIDGALFHDYTISNPDKHLECLMLWPGRRVTIRNSVFRNCTDFDVFVKPGYELTFENNFFDVPMPGETATVQCSPDCPRAGPALAFSAGSTTVIRHNSLLGAIRLDREFVGTNVVGGNIGPSSGCQSNASYSYNVWSRTACGATDRVAPLADVFVDPAPTRFQLQLKPGSRAIGAGDPANAPLRDIEGRLRPLEFAPDAGAWQREPALVVPGRAIGTADIGASKATIHGFYGRPRKSSREQLPNGALLDVEQHRVRGGVLRVTYRGERIVAISTTSKYYRTLKGLSPGSSLRVRPDDDLRCRPVGAPARRAVLYVRPTRAKEPAVAELVVVRRGFLPSCAIPKPRKSKK